MSSNGAGEIKVGDPQITRGGTSSSDRPKPRIDFAIPPDVQRRTPPDTASRSSEIRRIGPAMDSELLATYTKINKEIGEASEQHKKLQYSHHKKSREVILETAKAAYNPKVEKQKAAILGFGKGKDIPLAELAEMYYITIVDVDVSGAIEARKQLPENLRSKVTIVEADLTGVVSECYQDIKTAWEKTTSSQRLPRKLSRIAEDIATKIPGGPPDIGNDFSFVCSHLVPSQLWSILKDHLENTFDMESDKGQVLSRFLASAKAKNLEQLAQQEHSRYLARLVEKEKEGATIHVADTYGEVRPGGQEYSMLIPEKFESVIDEIFEKRKEPTTWTFDQWPIDMGGGYFKIKAFSLKVKPSETESQSALEKEQKVDEKGKSVDSRTSTFQIASGGRGEERPDRSGARTPPEIREQLTDIRDQVKDLFMKQHKEKEQLQDQVRALEAENKQLQDRVRALEAENKQLRQRAGRSRNIFEDL